MGDILRLCQNPILISISFLGLPKQMATKLVTLKNCNLFTQFRKQEIRYRQGPALPVGSMGESFLCLFSLLVAAVFLWLVAASPQSTLFFLKTVLAILGRLQFHMYFRISLLISTKCQLRFWCWLHWICTSSWAVTAILSMLTLKWCFSNDLDPIKFLSTFFRTFLYFSEYKIYTSLLNLFLSILFFLMLL